MGRVDEEGPGGASVFKLGEDLGGWLGSADGEVCVGCLHILEERGGMSEHEVPQVGARTMTRVDVIVSVIGTWWR